MDEPLVPVVPAGYFRGLRDYLTGMTLTSLPADPVQTGFARWLAGYPYADYVDSDYARDAFDAGWNARSDHGLENDAPFNITDEKKETMPTDLTSMFDTIHSDAANIPASAAKVAGYVTGTGDIQWTPADWARFPSAGRVRVDQSAAGREYAAGRADVYDMERYAGTPAAFGNLAAPRHVQLLPNNGYGSRTSAAAAADALDAVKGLDPGWWHGSGWWLADPSLSLAQATALIGTVLYGFTIRAVQWATPASNPDLQVPGGTLATLNLDLSAADAAWFPPPAKTPTWQQQALAQARALAAFLEEHQ